METLRIPLLTEILSVSLGCNTAKCLRVSLQKKQVGKARETKSFVCCVGPARARVYYQVPATRYLVLNSFRVLSLYRRRIHLPLFRIQHAWGGRGVLIFPFFHLFSTLSGLPSRFLG